MVSNRVIWLTVSFLMAICISGNEDNELVTVTQSRKASRKGFISIECYLATKLESFEFL